MSKYARIKKVLSFLLVLCMMLQYVPMAAFAADVDNFCEHHPEHTAECAYAEGESACTYLCDVCTVPEGEEPSAPEAESAPVEENYTVHTATAAPDADLPGNDELFEMYVEQKFYGYEMATFGTRGRDKLSGDQLAIYDALVPFIKDIAEGKRASTTIGLGQVVGNVNMGNGQIVTLVPEKEMNFTVSDFYGDEVNEIIKALMLDYPYEMYWYDKTSGYEYFWVPGSVILYLQFSFTVAPGYAAGTYTANTAKTGATAAASANAKAVVAANASKSDYEKLVAYKDYICNAVEYNYDAANSNYTGGYGDPWQLIYVFDNDPSTNVVCEGYAKAFQYLCDLGGLDCISVSGYTNGGHMWNVVTLEGKNYLVDVTNLDGNGIGSDGSLFLAGSVYENGKYTFSCYGTSFSYTCEDLDLATENYVSNSGSTEHVHSYDAANPTCACGKIGYCGGEGDGTNLTWVVSEDGKTVTISGTGKMGSYSFEGGPWCANYQQTITNAIIEPGVTSVGEDAFFYCTELKTVTIPEGVTTIGCFAFAESGLTKVDLPNSLTYIGEWAFQLCASLTEVVMHGGIETIDTASFAGCTALNNVTIPESVIYIWHYAFKNCTSLTSITIPANVQNMGDETFSGCTNLSEIEFLGNAPVIGPEVFYNVTATVSYPGNDTTWNADAKQQYGGTLTWVPYGGAHVHN